MPESKRTICVMSAPVVTFNDELMAELTKALDHEALNRVLTRALVRSQDRLLAQPVRNRKSDAYKARLLVKGMVGHLDEVSEELSALLGTKEASEAPDMGADELENDFVEGINIPTFQEYQDVFDQYPHVTIKKGTPHGDLLVLGYCSGRGKHSGKLYRRNCVVSMPSGAKLGFRELASTIGVLTGKGPDDTHYTIKAIPYVDGIGVRFWTNIVGEGDQSAYYRYLFFDQNIPVRSFDKEPFDDKLFNETLKLLNAFPYKNLRGVKHFSSEFAWEQFIKAYRTKTPVVEDDFGMWRV